MNDYENAPKSAEVKERDKYIAVELKNLQGIASRQDKLRDELLTRLIPVTRSEPSKQGKNPSESCGVPLADDLAAISQSLSVTNEVFEDILERLEI